MFFHTTMLCRQNKNKHAFFYPTYSKASCITVVSLRWLRDKGPTKMNTILYFKIGLFEKSMLFFSILLGTGQYTFVAVSNDNPLTNHYRGMLDWCYIPFTQKTQKGENSDPPKTRRLQIKAQELFFSKNENIINVIKDHPTTVCF